MKMDDPLKPFTALIKHIYEYKQLDKMVIQKEDLDYYIKKQKYSSCWKKQRYAEN
jgi:hypothetical protein